MYDRVVLIFNDKELVYYIKYSNNELFAGKNDRTKTHSIVKRLTVNTNIFMESRTFFFKGNELNILNRYIYIYTIT